MRSVVCLTVAAGLFAAWGVIGAGVSSQPGTAEPLLLRGDPEWARSFGGFRVYADPAQDAVMGFAFPTEVREILVKGGERVKAGDLLVRARDGEAVAALKFQRLRADNEWEVRAAANALELAEIEFRAMERAHQGGSGTQQEYDRVKNALENARITLEAAKMRLEEQRIGVERFEAELERFRLTAPFNGIVQSIDVSVGHAMGDSQPVIRVVDIDRLRLMVPTPTREVLSLNLKPGDKAWVVMNLPGEPTVLVGEVTEVSPVADAPTQQLRVKVEVANPDGRPAGVLSWVRFTAPEGEWVARMAQGGRDASPSDEKINASDAQRTNREVMARGEGSDAR